MQVALLVLALAAVDQATPSTSPADQQVERVRAALERPPSKLVPEKKADFSIHIEVRRPLQDIFDKPPWQLPPIRFRVPAMGYTAFGGIPIVNVDLLAIAGAIARGVNDARHARAAREASDEVRQAIAEYCAVQPNAATIQICSGSNR